MPTEGKEPASTNALRHGLLAKCLILQNESRERFDSLVTSISSVSLPPMASSSP
jgi:hypothetical protein